VVVVVGVGGYRMVAAAAMKDMARSKEDMAGRRARGELERYKRYGALERSSTIDHCTIESFSLILHHRSSIASMGPWPPPPDPYL
jgi:hypothetical protein